MFESGSNELVDDYQIVGIELADVKAMLNIDPTVEQYGCDVPTEDVPKFARYIADSVTLDRNYFYQIDFYRE